THTHTHTPAGSRSLGMRSSLSAVRKASSRFCRLVRVRARVRSTTPVRRASCVSLANAWLCLSACGLGRPLCPLRMRGCACQRVALVGAFFTGDVVSKKSKSKVKVALLSITLHVKTYKGLERTFPTLPQRNI